MNSLLRCCILAASAIALAACASQGSMGYAPSVASTPTDYTPDREYMAAVDYVARRRGVEVRWVNPPLKLAANTDVEDNGPD